MGGRGGSRLPTLPCRNPAGGLPSLSPASPAFSFLFCPHPPDPLPLRGRGRLKVFLCKGLRPLHPRGCTRAALAFLVENSAPMGACPGGCLPTLPCRNPAGSLPGWSPTDLALPEPGGELARVVADRPRLAGTRRGAQGGSRLPCLAGTRRGAQGDGCLPTCCFSFTSAPIPPSPRPPSPPGKGETKGYFMQGATPLASPGLNPGGTGFSCGK